VPSRRQQPDSAEKKASLPREKRILMRKGTVVEGSIRHRSDDTRGESGKNLVYRR
jgi:hypothetical protein